jgi:hypothetical protein
VFVPADLRRIHEQVKDRPLPHWNDDDRPLPFTILPVETAGQPDSEDPDLPTRVSEILMAKLDAMATSLEDAIDLDQEEQKLVARVTALTGTALSMGFVAWVLQSSTLLTSCLATLPILKSFDPLPVVRLSRRERNCRRKETDIEQRQEQGEFDGLKKLF